MAEKKSKDEKPSGTTFWEWIIAAAGLILVAATIGLTIYRAATEEKTPPKLEVIVDSIEPSGDRFLVRFLVKNTGNQTASAVTVEGELKNGTEPAETSSATLTYSPAHSERRGGLYFTRLPDSANLQIRATGYEEP